MLPGPEAVFVAGRVEGDAPTLICMGPPGRQDDLILAYAGELATPARVLRIVTVDQEVLGEVGVQDDVTQIKIFVTDLEEPDEIHVEICPTN